MQNQVIEIQEPLPVRVLWLAATLSVGWLFCPVASAAVPARMADCTVDLAASQEAFAIVKTEAEIARVRGPLLEQTLALLKNSPSGSSKPLIETLSSHDLVTFTEIRAKLLFTSVQDYLQSEHARDIDAIQTLWHIVIDRLDGKPNLPFDSKGSILSGLIRAVDENLADQPVTITVPENSTPCDLFMALSIAESRLIEINNRQMETVSSAIAWINGLIKKHAEMHGKMNFAQLNTTEQAKYKKLAQDVLTPAVERQQAVKDSEYLKTMYRLSAERTIDGEMDLTKTGGDTNAVGSTFKGKMRDSTTQILLGALYFMATRFQAMQRC